MKRHLFLSLFCVSAFVTMSGVQAQTVTVSKTGSPDYSTIQDAINHFGTDPDTGAPNVIQILDDSVYEETFTINAPLTLEGTGASRPRLLPMLNPLHNGNDGICIQVDNGATSNSVYLRNLIILPSLSSTPTDDGICSYGHNLYMEFDNVLVTANNGSNQPVTLDGLTAADMTGATAFGDDGIYVGGNIGATFPQGEGVEAVFIDTVVSHMQNGATTNQDGIVVAGNVNTVYKIMDGSVLSFNGRLGLQGARHTVLEGSKDNPVIVTGNKGFAGIWYASQSPDVRSISHTIIANNGGLGIEHQSGGTATFIIADSLLVNNGNHGLVIADTNMNGPTEITRSTIANSTGATASPITVNAAYAHPITITDSIIGGNGSSDAANTIAHNGTGMLTLSGTAAVTAGPYALTTATGGTGAVTGTPSTTADPEFVEVADLTSDDFFDVNGGAYATASSSGGPLGGGADFVGSASVDAWSLY